MIIQEKSGDILNSNEKFIAQQCNCVTIKSHGLSAVIAQKWPWANPYSSRTPTKPGNNSANNDSRDIPGSVRILRNPSASNDASAHIICLFAQWAPGKPGAYSQYYPSYHIDNAINRLKWFQKGLKLLDDDPNIDSPVAVPYNIGCGLAGGNWDHYRKALEDAETSFVIYKL